MKYACIAAHRRDYPVRLMCRVLAVSASGFYAAQQRPAQPPSARQLREAQLRAAIRLVHRESRATYGAPRIHAALVATGPRVAKKRIARLMRADGLVARRRRRGVRTTDARPAAPVAPNVLDRRFAVDAVGGPDRVWVGDITYIPTREGWLYLAVVLDLASRRVIGWAMRETLEAERAVAALRMALAHRAPPPGVLHHSDRGAQYACGDYRALLDAHGLVASMSRTGNCWDNAVAESFFATLKTELVDGAHWPTRESARAALFEYIEVWYNRRRRHSSLGYLSPAAYEARPLPQAA